MSAYVNNNYLILGAGRNGVSYSRAHYSPGDRIDESFPSGNWTGVDICKYNISETDILANFNDIDDVAKIRIRAWEMGMDGYDAILFDFMSVYFFRPTVKLMLLYRELLAYGGKMYIPYEPGNCRGVDGVPEMGLPGLLVDTWLNDNGLGFGNDKTQLPIGMNIKGFSKINEFQSNVIEICKDYTLTVLELIFGEGNVTFEPRLPGKPLDYPLKSYQFPYDQDRWFGVFVCQQTNFMCEQDLERWVWQYSDAYFFRAWETVQRRYIKQLRPYYNETQINDKIEDARDSFIASGKLNI